MNGRENLLRALHKDNPETVPFGFNLCPSLLEEFTKRTGSVDFAEYYNLPYRMIELPKTKHMNDYRSYYPYFPDNAFLDEWGIGYRPGSTAHFTEFLHPMARFTTPEEVFKFPLPDVLADYRWEGIAEEVQSLKEKGIAPFFFAVQIFEPAWYLRGLDNLLSDMMVDEDMAKACIDRMTDVQTIIAKKAAECGFDGIVFGDDVGTQRSMMMSVPLWRRWLRPTMEKAISAAKTIKPDVLAYYHSDGVIYDIIPDLIEIGVDILNPVQPECMDPALIKKMFGDRLSFWGTLGTQTTMPFGSAQDVREVVRHMIRDVGYDGGLVLAPTHLLEPEVPWENIEAFIEAVKEYNYPK